MAFKVGDHYEKPVNPGDYIVEVVNLTQDVSAKKKTVTYNLTLRIIGTAFADRTLNHAVYITDKALKMVAALMVHFGVDVELEFDLDDPDETYKAMQGKRAKAHICIETFGGVDYAKVEYFKALTATEVNAAKSIISAAPAKRDSTNDFKQRDKPKKEETSEDSYDSARGSGVVPGSDDDIPF